MNGFSSLWDHNSDWKIGSPPSHFKNRDPLNRAYKTAKPPGDLRDLQVPPNPFQARRFCLLSISEMLDLKKSGPAFGGECFGWAQQTNVQRAELRNTHGGKRPNERKKG
ncbi:MAG: hypothetical protein Q9202_002816 [Teloschistes flavicans]